MCVNNSALKANKCLKRECPSGNNLASNKGNIVWSFMGHSNVVSSQIYQNFRDWAGGGAPTKTGRSWLTPKTGSRWETGPKNRFGDETLAGPGNRLEIGSKNWWEMLRTCVCMVSSTGGKLRLLAYISAVN